MTADEERCWAYLVAHRQADADEIARECRVTPEFAAALLQRPSSPNWREPVRTER